MIDRSNPLPIHQFPCLIDGVVRLKELAAKDEPGTFSTEAPEMQYMVEVLNAAPELLTVLGGFQAGDMQLIDVAIEEFSRYGDDESRRVRDLLRRYHDMAQAMEATK